MDEFARFRSALSGGSVPGQHVQQIQQAGEDPGMRARSRLQRHALGGQRALSRGHSRGRSRSYEAPPWARDRSASRPRSSSRQREVPQEPLFRPNQNAVHWTQMVGDEDLNRHPTQRLTLGDFFARGPPQSARQPQSRSPSPSPPIVFPDSVSSTASTGWSFGSQPVPSPEAAATDAVPRRNRWNRHAPVEAVDMPAAAPTNQALPSPTFAPPIAAASASSFVQNMPPPRGQQVAPKPHATSRQGERKQQKKQNKHKAKESMDGEQEEDEKKAEALRMIEAQIIADEGQKVEEPQEEREQLVGSAIPAAPSEADETASVISGTTNTSRMPGRIHFEEHVVELETVIEDDGESERRRALEEMFEKHIWYVTFTDEAFAELRKLVRSQQKAVLDVFTALASGKWPEEHCVKLNESGYQRLKRASGGQQHILWSLDMQYVRAQKSFVEVIKIWHVLGEEDSQQAADSLIDEWKRSARSFEGIKRALQNKKSPEENGVRYPRTVMRSELQDSDVFSLRKFYTLDWRTMRSLLMDDSEGGQLGAGEQFLLNTSEQEDAIIEKKGPMIVIGRSGSGKTLCCAYRMFYQWVDYWKKSMEADGAALLSCGNRLVHLNQVFVTHSASLANKVLEYFSNLQLKSQDTVPQTRRSGLLEQSRHPDVMKQVKNFPLFITYRKFLIMLDGCLDRPFFPRRSTGALHPDKVVQAEAADGLDPISALREQRRAAVRAQAFGRHGASSAEDRVLYEVDYDLFKLKFWPKLCQKVPSGCDAVLVWREFMSFIKGSYRVLDSEQGYLDLATYQEVTSKCSPGFKDFRKEIYAAFKTYEKLREEWNYFDRMDVARHVIQQLKRNPYEGPPIHFSAVDEVQDLAQLELAVFFMVMKKPYEELFLTGDTSQTVSRAVEFRFCDLQSLFHYFNPREKVPELDQLLINYRSHQKILALSHRGVVQPLELAFPYAIDKLAADTGHRDGVLPVIVKDVALEDLAQTMFNLSGCSAGIAFGASQCILVRNEASRKKLPQSLSNALVLTVEQSKGLEFDDCILVNFFTDSLYDEWQTMKIFLPDLLEGQRQDPNAPRKRPQFENFRHALLCSELKHLYTAITRTKHVLLFFEDDRDKASHVFKMWEELGLVSAAGLMDEENKEARAQIHQHAGENRGKESWVHMGHNLLNRRLYEQARSAFIRADDQRMAQICEAHLKAQEANRTLDDSEAEGVQLFRDAAKMFKEAGARWEEAECWRFGKYPQKAAIIFEELGQDRPDLKVEAARAWGEAGNFDRAAELYEEEKRFEECIQAYQLAERKQDVGRVVLLAHEGGDMKAEHCFRYLQDIDDHQSAGELFFREDNFEQAASCFQSAGSLAREAECYNRLNQPLRAAERLSASDEAEHLREAAGIYRKQRETVAELKCYRSLLKIDDLKDRELVMETCIHLHASLQQWGPAAELLEELAKGNRVDQAANLQEAAEFYAQAGQPMDEARVYERLAGMGAVPGFLMPGDSTKYLREAKRLYGDAKALKELLRVSEQLREYKACGDLARELGELSKAAHFYDKAGTEEALQMAMECMIMAKDFETAYKYFSNLSWHWRERPETIELEIICLEGLGKFDSAARRVMATLQSIRDNKSRQQREEKALRAFKLANKDSEKRKQFFDDFRDEMPDEQSALIYWAEMGDDALQICERFLQCGKPLASVAAASELGQPDTALTTLHKCQLSWKDWHWYTLEILLGAVQQKKLSTKQIRAMSTESKELRQTLPEDSIDQLVCLDYVDAVLRRLGGDTGREKLALRSSYNHVEVPAELSLCFGEELALAKCAEVRDATWTLNQLDWYINEVSNGEQIEPLLSGCYQVGSKLQEVLYKELNDLRRQRSLPPVTATRVLAKGHRLAETAEALSGFAGASRLADPRAAIIEDLEDRRLALLQNLQELCQCKKDEMLACTAPSLWLSAWKQHEKRSPQLPRTQSFKDGFLRSVQFCASLPSATTLDRDVIARMPEAAEELWSRARADAESVLRSPATKMTEFTKLAHHLQKVIRDVASLFRHEIWMTESDPNKVAKQVAEKVAELVLRGLDKLMPICPHHVFNKKCEAKKKGECVLEHPDVGKTHDPWSLLACGTSTGKATSFDGIGLDSWISIVNVCKKTITTGVPCKGKCPWMHPGTYELQKIQEKLKKLSRSEYVKFDWSSIAHLEAVLQVLLESLHKGGADVKIDSGFGCCFVKDSDKMLNVRLVTILASAFMSKRSCHLGLEASTEVLLRMCRSLYRYPDPEAADLAKSTLGEVRHIEKLSNTITWEVEGCQNKESHRCLLSSLLGRNPPWDQKRRHHAGGQPTVQSNLRADAQPFVPIGSAPERRVWLGNAATYLFPNENLGRLAAEATQQVRGDQWRPHVPQRGMPAGSASGQW